MAGGSMATVGARGGKPSVPLLAPSTTYMLLSIFPVGSFSAGFGDLAPGYKNVAFQLVPEDMTTGGVLVVGTFDRATASGNGDLWEPCVAPSSEAAYQWTNPLTVQAGQRLLKVDAAFIAYAAQTTDDYNGTEAFILSLAAP